MDTEADALAETRRSVIDACRATEREAFEQIPEHEVGSIRDLVTGPVVDALFEPGDIVRKSLSTGEIFEFPYRSRITREFVMAEPDPPDHVWEPQTTKVLCALASGRRDVIVGGAYFGDQAILIARAMARTGGEGRVHAFEPDDEERAALQRNVTLNELTNVVVRGEPLWREPAAPMMTVGDDALASVVPVEGDAAALDQASTTIDTYIAEADIDGLDLVMLDLEGGEEDALRGAAAALSAPTDEAPAVVIEIHRTWVDWTDGLAATAPITLLTDRGYEVFAIRDIQGNRAMTGMPIELIPLDDIWLEGPPHGFNVLAVRSRDRLDALPDVRFVSGVSPKLLEHKDPALHAPVGGFPS